MIIKVTVPKPMASPVKMSCLLEADPLTIDAVADFSDNRSLSIFIPDERVASVLETGVKDVTGIEGMMRERKYGRGVRGRGDKMSEQS